MEYNGAGSWSLYGYIIAASVPNRPATPKYLSSNSTSITLGLTPSTDDGGLLI